MGMGRFSSSSNPIENVLESRKAVSALTLFQWAIAGRLVGLARIHPLSESQTMIRSRWTILTLATLLSCAALQGDQPKKPETAAPPLPRYYRKLGLNEGQAEKVRKSWARYKEKIEGLKRQIQELQKEAAAELEKPLTVSQKARLKELRALGPGDFKLD